MAPRHGASGHGCHCCVKHCLGLIIRSPSHLANLVCRRIHNAAVQVVHVPATASVRTAGGRVWSSTSVAVLLAEHPWLEDHATQWVPEKG
jgi:hypothetical protein